MAKKKGKKKKSKSKAQKSENEQPEDLDLVGDGAQLGISKEKKKKKSKLSKEEKALAKIEKQLDQFLSDSKKYENFWNKLHNWIRQHHAKIEISLRRYDSEEEGVVPFEVFKANMRDLESPALELEIFALARILDQEKTGLIDYTNLKDGLLLPNEEDSDDDGEDHAEVDMKQDDYVPKVYSSREPLSNQILCDPSQMKYPRFLKLSLKLKEFARMPSHPGNFEATVKCHLTVSGLLQVIQQVTEISTGQLNLYTNEHCTQENCLAPYLLLTDCGFTGGPENNPQKGILYYDYAVEFDDCPLLNCDFYFGHDSKPLNPVLKGYQKS